MNLANSSAHVPARPEPSARERFEALDWVATPLGPREGWPPELRFAAEAALSAGFPSLVYWGPDLVIAAYNDAYLPIAVGKVDPLGRANFDVWPESREAVAPFHARALAGETVTMRDACFPVDRGQGLEEVWFDFSLQPVRGEEGAVAGIFCTAFETTERVRAAREGARAEDALREQEARLRGVLDGMGEAFGILDRDFRILTFNRAALALEPRPLEEIVGRSHWEVYPGSEDSEIGRLYKRAMAERVPVSLEHRYVWEDGTARWLDMRAFPVEEGLAVFWRDITERKEVETALRASERRQSALLALEDVLRPLGEPEQIKAAAAELLGRELGAGRVTYAEVDEDAGVIRVARSFTARGMGDAAGEYRLAELGALVGLYRTGDTFVSADLWADARVRQAAERPEVEANGGRGVLDVPLVKEGRLVALLSVNDPAPRQWAEAEVRLAETVAERTWSAVERAQAEAALRASEAVAWARANELRTVLDAVPAAIWVAQDPSCAVITGNKVAAELLRLPTVIPNMSKGAPDPAPVAHFRVLDAEGREIATEDLPVQRAARGETLHEFEERIVFDDGSAVDVLGNATALLDEAGHVRGAVAAFVDITARKRAEERLRRATQAARMFTWETDQATGETTWGDGTAAIVGLPEEALLISTRN
ncbi:PAS domain-containing protein [Rubellimicrobium roseum]|uniref:PAS domain S-box protein n=1 Tax=Rubellimicrobium roseum TaxID=687525 RepID=A0A5C4NA97_9RHOB|nr:PAS domain-containing protein [Rubellimicrobium roseum]TNC60031.1 PAS domain S-box protein [Rubellimicrobium roseum]